MLTPSLLKTGLRDLVRRPLQTALMVLGIALGVAVVIAIDLANTSASRAFRLSTETVVGRATHQLTGGPAGLPQSLYTQLRREWGLTRAAPVVEGMVIAPDLDAQPLQLLGVDPLAEAPFRSFFGNAGSATPGLERFYTEPNTVIVGAGLASRYGLGIDSPVRLQVAERFVTVTVVGLLDSANAANARTLDGLALVDVSTAQELLGLAQTQRLSRIDLILSPAEADTLSARLPPGVRLAPANEQTNTVAQLTSAFQLNLTALSLLALVVGMFLIYNTVMFSVVQRRQVLGTLRALGVTAGQLFWLIQVETAAVALIGTVLGLGLGWLLGQGAVRLVTQTINDLYYVLSVREAPLTLFSVAKGVGLGLGAGAAAAAFPGLEAAQVEPVTMLRRSTLEERVRAFLPRLGLAGVVLSGVGLAALLGVPKSLGASFAGLFAIVIGLALIVPIATAWLMRLAGAVLGRTTGSLGRMAARTVTNAISRTSVAIAALMVAVSVTIGVSVMIGSFRETVENWLDLSLVADIYLSVPTPGGTRSSAPLDPGLPGVVSGVAGVEEVDTIRNVVVPSPQGDVQLAVADTQRRRSAGLYRYASGDPEAVWQAMLNGAVIVSEPFAYRNGISPQGGSVTLITDAGPRTFPVAAIYYDYSSDRGSVLMTSDVYLQHWADAGLTGVAVYVAPGAEPQAVADALRARLAGTAVRVQVNRALRDEALVIFDRTFAITNALRILAVVVAFIGVLSALMALQTERARELATLQALGLTTSQLWRLTLTETGLMGLTAGLLSLPTGLVLAWVLIYVINLRSFGWTIQLALAPWIFAQALAVSVTAAMLAAIYPMRRLLQLPVATALRQE